MSTEDAKPECVRPLERRLRHAMTTEARFFVDKKCGLIIDGLKGENTGLPPENHDDPEDELRDAVFAEELAGLMSCLKIRKRKRSASEVPETEFAAAFVDLRMTLTAIGAATAGSATLAVAEALPLKYDRYGYWTRTKSLVGCTSIGQFLGEVKILVEDIYGPVNAVAAKRLSMTTLVILLKHTATLLSDLWDEFAVAHAADALTLDFFDERERALDCAEALLGRAEQLRHDSKGCAEFTKALPKQLERHFPDLELRIARWREFLNAGGLSRGSEDYHWWAALSWERVSKDAKSHFEHGIESFLYDNWRAEAEPWAMKKEIIVARSARLRSSEKRAATELGMA
jgi:hypothetical protein